MKPEGRTPRDVLRPLIICSDCETRYLPVGRPCRCRLSFAESLGLAPKDEPPGITEGRAP
jgi:hypothetical protein